MKVDLRVGRALCLPHVFLQSVHQFSWGQQHCRRDILGLERNVSGVDAHAFQHAHQALFGERGVDQIVARTIEAYHNSVADQHIVPDAFEIDNVLNARRGVGRLFDGDAQEQGGQHATPEQRSRHRIGDRQCRSVSVQFGQ